MSNSGDDPFHPYTKSELKGPGDIKPAKRRRDLATIDAAFDQIAPGSPLICQASSSPSMSPEDKKDALVSLTKATLPMKPQTEQRWALTIFGAVFDLYDAKNYKKASTYAKSLIEEIRGHFTSSSSAPTARPWLASIFLAHAFLMLAKSHRQLGGAGNQNTTHRKKAEYKRAIQYATESLYYFRSIQEWAKDIPSPSCIYKRKVALLLYLRGHTLRRFDLDKSYKDLKACIAVIRSVARGVWEGPKETHHPAEMDAIQIVSLEQARKRLQMIMAMQKIRDKAPRPHYNGEEREEIAKDLGLGVYAGNIYRCLWCGVDPSMDPKVRLKQCSKCHVVWVCSKECLTKAWHSFHKKECIKRERVVETASFIDKRNMGDYDKFAFEKYGVFIIELNGESHAAVHDKAEVESKRQYFESLSDRDILVGDPADFMDALKIVSEVTGSALPMHVQGSFD